VSQITLREVAAHQGLVGGPFGSNLVSADYVEDGVPVIRGENLNWGKQIGGSFVFVSEGKVARDLTRNLAKEGDLIFTQRGTLGQVAIVPQGGPLAYVISQSQMMLRVDPSKARGDYLYYACTSSDFKKQVSDRAISTGVPHINLGILGDLVVPLPPLDTQSAIAEVLGALDDKIAANRGLQAAVDRLTTALVERELTSTAPLGHIATVVMGTSPRGDTMNEEGEGVDFFQGVRDFGFRVPVPRVFTTTPVKLAAAGDLLVSVRAPVGRINRADTSVCIGRGLAAVRSTTSSPALLFHALVGAKAAWEPFNHEGTVFGSINQTDIRRIEVPWVDLRVINGLEATIEPLERRIDQCVVESMKLATLRDTLLPHLMSGRITVRDAEDRVEKIL
jgi:type I restriction enzyme S subunit